MATNSSTPLYGRDVHPSAGHLSTQRSYTAPQKTYSLPEFSNQVPSSRTYPHSLPFEANRFTAPVIGSHIPHSGAESRWHHSSSWKPPNTRNDSSSTVDSIHYQTPPHAPPHHASSYTSDGDTSRSSSAFYTGKKLQTRTVSDNTMLQAHSSGRGSSDVDKPPLDSSQTTNRYPQTSNSSVSDSHISYPIPQPPSSKCFSQATLENQRYSLEGMPTSDHPNEDRHFSLDCPGYKAFGVFDGHDGPRAAGFASNYILQLFDTVSWMKLVKSNDSNIVCEALKEFFVVTDKDFFKGMERYINEKESIQRRIPQHLTSYAAYQRYPNEVTRLQEIEPMLSGGCTAVIAVIVKNRLYVANVGDSRAVLIYEQRNRTLTFQQLSVDHSVENEDELKRLEQLGLDPKELIKSGRLGTQENTRSIGDYSIKQGYKNVDSLRSAQSAPGIVTPYIMPPKNIDHTFKYLILMTDGVYKSIECTFEDQNAIDVNKVLLHMLERSLHMCHGKMETMADSVLERTAKIHQDLYTRTARVDIRSPKAVDCRKRDDMTLLVYKFPDSV